MINKMLTTIALSLALGTSAMAQTSVTGTGSNGTAGGTGGAFAQGDRTGAVDEMVQYNAMTGQEGPARDAMGDPPVNPGASASVAERSSGPMPFPAPLIGDGDMELHATPFPSGYHDSAEADPRAGPGIEPGEVIPPRIEAYQGPDMWEANGLDDVDSDTGPSTLAEKHGRAGDAQEFSAEKGPAFAWDGLEESVPAIRGRQFPNPDATAAISEQGEARDRTQDRDTDALADRRLRLARIAQRSARRAVPGGQFTSYDFQIENGLRVIEVAGTDAANGRHVEVDVFSNGRIESISHVISLNDVPDAIRSAVRSELGRFRVAKSRRSTMSDFDVYYEFAGFAESGRPATVAIRSDGNDLNVRYYNGS